LAFLVHGGAEADRDDAEIAAGQGRQLRLGGFFGDRGGGIGAGGVVGRRRFLAAAGGQGQQDRQRYGEADRAHGDSGFGAYWRAVRGLPGSSMPGVARKGLMSRPPRRV